MQIDWTAAPNAERYVIYAVNVAQASDDDGEVVTRAVNNADATTYNIDGLTVGQDYDIYVVATASGEDARVARCRGSGDSRITGPASTQIDSLGAGPALAAMPTEQSQGNREATRSRRANR